MTQKERVLEALRSGPLTQLKATNDLGVLRLSERIRELQKDGHEIKHTPIVVKNRFGSDCRVMEYSLVSEHCIRMQGTVEFQIP